MRKPDAGFKVVAAIALLALGLGLFATLGAVADPLGGDCESGGDAGDNAASGNPVTNPVVCTGEIDHGLDADWYRISLSGSPNVLVTAMRAQFGNSAFQLHLVDPTGTDRTAADCLVAQTSTTVCRDTAPPSGTWAIGITYAGGPQGTYTLAIGVIGTTAPSPPPVPTISPVPSVSGVPSVSPLPSISQSLPSIPTTDCTTGDAGNTPATASDFPAGQLICIGGVSSIDDAADWYRVPLAANQTFLGVLVPLADTTELKIQKPSGVSVTNACINSGVGACLVPTIAAADAGVWKLGVTILNGSGSYVLLHLVLPDPTAPPSVPPLPSVPGPGSCEPAPGGVPGDAGNTSAAASPLPWQTPTQTQALCDGSLASAATDPEDWYVFNVVSDTAAMQIDLQPLDAGTDVDFLVLNPVCVADISDPNCVPILKNANSTGGPEFASFPFPDTSPRMYGTWKLRVLSIRGTYPAPYRLGVSIEDR